MTRHQISNALRKALEASRYSSLFRKQHGSCCYLCFEMNDEEVSVCPPKQGCGVLSMFPDQVKDDTFVVSTDVIRLPQDMDEDAIDEILKEINSNCTGIRYEMPFLYHGIIGLNRAVLVIKDVCAVSYEHITDVLPKAIEDVLEATKDFQNLFSQHCQD